MIEIIVLVVVMVLILWSIAYNISDLRGDVQKLQDRAWEQEQFRNREQRRHLTANEDLRLLLNHMKLEIVEDGRFIKKK